MWLFNKKAKEDPEAKLKWEKDILRLSKMTPVMIDRRITGIRGWLARLLEVPEASTHDQFEYAIRRMKNSKKKKFSKEEIEVAPDYLKSLIQYEYIQERT